MNLPAVFLVLRWMVRDTFRQSLGSRAFWLVLGLSCLAIFLCLSVGLEGTALKMSEDQMEYEDADKKPATGLNPGKGYITIAFGLIRYQQMRDGKPEILQLQSQLAMFGAGMLGILLVLLWTCGFLPEFLQTESASVLLAKPLPRWALLVGKYLGVVLFMALQTTFFVVGTWLALGWKTGIWYQGYLWTIPVVVVYFAILFSFMTLLAVWTRSAVVSIVGTLLFWGICAGVSQTRNQMIVHDAPPSVGRSAAEAGYWILPKPNDLVYLLYSSLSPTEGRVKLPPIPELDKLEKQNEFHPGLSIICSLLFSGFVLGLAARRFATADY